MRSTLVTGSLALSVVLLLCAPGLTVRSSAEPPPEVVPPDTPVTAPVVVAMPSADWLAPALPALRAGDWDAALAALEVATPPDAADERGRHDLVLGMLLERAGRCDEAKAPLRAAAKWADASGSSLSARAWFHLGEAREDCGDLKSAAKAFRHASQPGRGALARWALLREARASASDGHADRALEALRLLVGDEIPSAPSGGHARSDDELRSTAAAEALVLAERQGDEDLAARARRVLLVDYPCSQAAHDLAGGWSEVAVRFEALGAERVVRRCERLVDCGGAREALVDLELLDERAPSDRVSLLRGRALRATGDLPGAVASFADVGPSDGALVSQATWEASLARRSMRKTREARTLQEACAEGPATSWRDRAAMSLADADADAGRLSAARKWWRLVAADGATATVRAKAAWKIGWSQYRTGLKSAALATFDALADGAPREREAAAARYWAARIVRDRKDAGGAQERLVALARDFPHDYYGLVAAQETSALRPACDPCSSSSLDVALARNLRRLAETDAPAALAAGELLRLGLVDDALEELAHADAPEGAPSLARDEARVMTLAVAGRHLAALRAFREAVPDWRTRTDVSGEIWCALYPLEEQDLVLANCRERGLDPALVCGLIHQESVFEPKAVSWVGARGLMQVMPSTGRQIAGWFGEKVSTAQLEEPEVNVRYGTEYLRRLLDEHGSAEIALAGYNAGGGRAKKWWKAAGGDLPLFVESIPFDETRDYVKAIAWGSFVYRSAWGDALAAGDPETTSRALPQASVASADEASGIVAR